MMSRLPGRCWHGNQDDQGDQGVVGADIGPRTGRGPLARVGSLASTRGVRRAPVNRTRIHRRSEMLSAAIYRGAAHRRRCPNGLRCADVFHVAAWATDTLDQATSRGLTGSPDAALPEVVERLAARISST